MLLQLENETAKRVTDKFRNIFGIAEALVVRSPGRVNIIGEHTDYNEGLVLPAAIDKAIYVAIDKRTDGHIHLYSVAFKEKFEINISEI